jgi:hypothetical protein
MSAKIGFKLKAVLVYCPQLIKMVRSSSKGISYLIQVQDLAIAEGDNNVLS